VLTHATGQENVLSRRYSFSSGNIKTEAALNIISQRTGYYFTYDSRIVDSESRTALDFEEGTLNEILRRVLKSDSLQFSLVGNHIIISRIPSNPVVEISIANAETIYQLSGQVVDSENGEPLPFATVGVKNKPRGTVTNIDGIFTMNLASGFLNDTLAISYLGYMNREIPVIYAVGNDFSIKMFRDYIPIPEIIIRTQPPLEIIRKSNRAVPDNFGTTPASMQGFYREGILKGRDLQLYSEAVLQIYKSSYSNARFNDQVKVIRSRKTENITSGDTVLVRLKAGLGTSLLLDGVRNLFEFMDEENFHQYRYNTTDIVTIDDATAYVIEFEQMDFIREPLFRGSLMVHTANYALMQADFEINPAYIGKSADAFVSGANRGYTIKPVSVRYRVSYSKRGDRYYLSHVRGDLRFSIKKRRRVFNTFTDVFFEMAVTSANTSDITRFEKDEIIPLESVFSRTVNGYDPRFWGDFDFLRPEDDLMKALDRINLKISGYNNNEK
jgi:hypothetical protein